VTLPCTKASAGMKLGGVVETIVGSNRGLDIEFFLKKESFTNWYFCVVLTSIC
jgi:hypothetical protein